MSADAAQDPGCRNLRWSLALLDGLCGGGMRDLVLSPGSRSTPLVLAAQHHPELTLTPVLDERSAGFFALGLARASRRPVGLLCTSGSAPAHWLPAVIEAAEWGVPLVLISADRPPELRGWGANQTIDQTRLFGAFVREFHDPGPPLDTQPALKAMRALGSRLASTSNGRCRGPVHINLPLPEPLIPGGDCELAPRATQTAEPPGAETRSRWAAPRAERAAIDGLSQLFKGRGLICCGPADTDPQAATALWRCAEALSLPVLVDPLSGLRCAPAPRHRIAHYDSLLRNPEAARRLRPDWVLRTGRMPVSKALTTWLTGIPTILVDPAERWCDPTHDAQLQIGAPLEAVLTGLGEADLIEPDAHWLAEWIAADQRIAALAQRHLDETPWCEGHLIQTLMTRVPATDALFCANSLPIRQLDTWSGTRPASLPIFANRGVSGIDGQSSTLAGLNAAGRPTWGLLGDLAFCHDLSGLFLADRLDRPVLVLNNGGGRIFDYLPQRALANLEAYWRTPRPLALDALARAFGLECRRIDGALGLEQVLCEAPRGQLIEVQIDAALSQQAHETFWRRIAQDDIF